MPASRPVPARLRAGRVGPPMMARRGGGYRVSGYPPAATGLRAERARLADRRRGKYADPASPPLPDLILLDLYMPGLDGRELLGRLKSDEASRSIPVVLLTTSQQEADIVRSYDLGCNSFITKPVDIENFIQVV